MVLQALPGFFQRRDPAHARATKNVWSPFLSALTKPNGAPPRKTPAALLWARDHPEIVKDALELRPCRSVGELNSFKIQLFKEQDVPTQQMYEDISKTSHAADLEQHNTLMTGLPSTDPEVQARSVWLEIYIVVERTLNMFLQGSRPAWASAEAYVPAYGAVRRFGLYFHELRVA